jgi:hypothetical protein
VVPAAEFIEVAESSGLMPKLDNLLMFRCVQVMRRLQMKNRDVGLFCNVSITTLQDVVYFKQFLDFMDANRVLGPSMLLEFTHAAYRSFGPLENEALASLAERGFRFSLDHISDLRLEPKELADRGFRCVKVPAKMLLSRITGANSDIHPADLADLLASTWSPSVSKARAWWSICSTTMCASVRVSCSRRRARCAPRRCKPAPKPQRNVCRPRRPVQWRPRQAARPVERRWRSAHAAAMRQHERHASGHPAFFGAGARLRRCALRRVGCGA